MQSIFQLVMLFPATLFVLTWIYVAVRHEKEYAQITQSLEGKGYQFHELFFIGFYILKLVRFNPKSERARKRTKEVAEIYGKQYADYYYYVMRASQASYTATLLPAVCLLTVLSNNAQMLLFGIVIIALMIWYVEELFKDKLTERREELLMSFPQVLSKITLLMNAGMVLREAWSRVADSGQGIVYEEMKLTMADLQNGKTEYEAYKDFGDRCALKEIRKFSSMVLQNLSKGSVEFSYFVKEMSDEMWEEKKHLVRQKAEKSNAKLLMPTVMIFIGILIMIMVPVLGSI